ncbi:MAG: hypothetical protein AMJ38_00595 [Dehalococcoidia bacterium DG_22]|nr:MAG: hypothetical protein AMJ38_00595 [Dehalococcoidia bacterium DG_22]
MTCLTYRRRKGVEEARCHECHKWTPLDKLRLKAHPAMGLPLNWPLGFQVAVCPRCSEKV